MGTPPRQPSPCTRQAWNKYVRLPVLFKVGGEGGGTAHAAQPSLAPVFYGNLFSMGILVHVHLLRCLPLQLLEQGWGACMGRKHNVSTPFAVILQKTCSRNIYRSWIYIWTKPGGGDTPHKQDRHGRCWHQ